MSDSLILWGKPYTIPGYLPSALSLTRILLMPVYLSLLRSASPLALPLYLAACATDLLDGKAARLLGSSSADGAALDASADFLLLAAGFTHYASTGLVSPLLLGLMTLSFTQYMYTMGLPVVDTLGKHVGTVLYALLGALTLAPSTQAGAAASAIGAAYTAASLIHRLRLVQKYHESKSRNGHQPPPSK
jgi:CDP-diacylglycerol--glycerol-3-phosphate 3-phosphatidyltransferase/cardiolipin synthase